MKTVVLVGSLDTKGAEYAYARDRLGQLGVRTLVVDTGTLGEPAIAPDVSASEVAAAGGAGLDQLRQQGSRGEMQAAMIAGATAVVRRLRAEGRLDAVFALGGSNNTATAAAVFRTLPLGVPKVILTTMAVPDARALVGASDLVLAASVVDIAGLNQISRLVIANAAAAVAGMALAPPRPSGDDDRALVVCSMIGLTTRAVTAARSYLEDLGYEVVVFHMTGLGGAAMEELIAGGSVAGVLDLTTSELADELFGGVCSAGPQRLRGAAGRGVPQVVAPGGLDMINFGRPDTVPARLTGRVTQVHNAEVTLVRTSPAECAQLGQILAERVSGGRAGDAVSVILLPSGGLSAIDVPGQPFHDPQASAALAAAVRHHVDPARVTVVDVEGDLDRPEVGRRAAELLHDLIAAMPATVPR